MKEQTRARLAREIYTAWRACARLRPTTLLALLLPNVEADTYHLVGMDSSLDCAFAFVEEE